MDLGLRGKKALVTGASKDTGLAMANSKVAESMFKMATKGHPKHVRYQAAAFWLKCRAGWRETRQIEIIRPITQMSREEIRAALEINGRDPAALLDRIVGWSWQRQCRSVAG